MKKPYTRIFSLLLALVLAFSCCLPAMAMEDEFHPEEQPDQAADAVTQTGLFMRLRLLTVIPEKVKKP